MAQSAPSHLLSVPGQVSAFAPPYQTQPQQHPWNVNHPNVEHMNNLMRLNEIQKLTSQLQDATYHQILQQQQHHPGQ
jgi:hypothetical protein